MAERDEQDSELRNHLMRFRVMEAETTDPIAIRFLHDIVVDLEAELDRQYHATSRGLGCLPLKLQSAQINPSAVQRS